VPLPVVAIIGRPNVGKSTLFNRLVRTHQAIVDDTPGITRDRLYRQCSWNGVDFMLVDTGGLLVRTDDVLEVKVTQQARIAVEQADAVIFLVDSRVGILEDDIRIARELKRSKKKVIAAANKVDSPDQEHMAAEFHSLGFESLVATSAINGLNTGDLLDMVVEVLPTGAEDEFREDIRVAIVGRPNVGKSSLVNALTGEDVAIVADLPGTTRDAIDSRYEVDGRKYVLIDTAGLKKKNIYENQLEYYTMLRTMRALARCDIAVVVIDSNDGLVAGDLRIAAEAAELGKGIIFAFNKWDVVEKDELTADRLRKAIAKKAPSFSFVPVLFVSALTGQRVLRIWEVLHEISLQRKKRIPTSELNKFVQDIIERKPPPARGGKFIKIFYVTQPEGDPPTFLLFSNYPKLLEKTYRRYMENRFRENFGFQGTPIRLIFKQRK
jgi:GTP-binding protein